MQPNIVSRDQWLAARKALLAKEREVTHLRDEVAAQRRALPWVKIETPYAFQSTSGPVTLADLFDGRSQLLVQHFMLTPGKDHICPGCSLMADHVPGASMHFKNADLSFAAISRAPIEQIEAARTRMGWDFPWVSSGGTSFNYDFGVSYTPEQIAEGKPLYNFGTTSYLDEDVHGTSVFAKNEAGEVFHTYSTYARGDEAFIGAFSFLDLVPKGRNEQGTMSWVRLHDEYESTVPVDDDCCG